VNCERLRTEDSTRYCVHAVTSQRLLHGPITEEIYNIKKVCGLSYSQYRCSYHKTSCVVSSVSWTITLDRFSYVLSIFHKLEFAILH